MSKNTGLSLRLIAIGLFLFSAASFAIAADGVRFKVRLDPAAVAGTQPVSGRLLIFMTRETKSPERIDPDFTDPSAVWISGTEIRNLEPGKTIDVDADTLAFPAAFSKVPEGTYQIMALLDRDHSYTYDGPGGGDLLSVVVKAKMPDDETDLTLSKVIPERKIEVPANARLIEFESPMLSAFWGRPISMQASVILPPSYDKAKTQRYPTVYSVSGYGGSHLGALRGAANLSKGMAEGRWPEMIYVYLNAKCPLGHHVFADSANNGPWGTALTREFIPYIEKQFRMDARPSGRFLTGHSSGGWTTLWVMVTHPDFFGGTWSTSPDPADFRNFTGPDLTAYPPNNFYRDAAGKPYPLVRMDGKELMSLEQYSRQERVLGYYGGQIASFEAVFSPKGPDGQPMPIFDRDTGKVDPAVQRAWEKYDISRLLRANWKTLGPKLRGKLHIICGTADTFHLDEPLRMLEAELKKLGSDAKIEFLEGRTHFDLYKDGLGDRIAEEMYAVARPKAKVQKPARK
jgi:S-formylglutathione hydrolase FrmB